MESLKTRVHDSCRTYVYYTQYMSTICAIYTALTNYEVVTDWYIHVAALDNNSPDGLYTNVDEITERNCHLQ